MGKAVVGGLGARPWVRDVGRCAAFEGAFGFGPGDEAAVDDRPALQAKKL
jgi:hypothetical protein